MTDETKNKILLSFAAVAAGAYVAYLIYDAKKSNNVIYSK